MNKPYESVLSLTPESVAGMAPVELRKLATKEIHALLAKSQEEGRARSWFSAMLLGVVLPHFFGSARDAGCGCLNIAVPFLGLGHLVSRSYIMWVLQLALCMGVPFMLWPGHDQFWYAIGVSYALGILLNLLSFFVLKKIAFVLHWLHLARKVRRGLAGLHAGSWCDHSLQRRRSILHSATNWILVKSGITICCNPFVPEKLMNADHEGLPGERVMRLWSLLLAELFLAGE